MEIYPRYLSPLQSNHLNRNANKNKINKKLTKKFKLAKSAKKTGVEATQPSLSCLRLAPLRTTRHTFNIACPRRSSEHQRARQVESLTRQSSSRLHLYSHLFWGLVQTLILGLAAPSLLSCTPSLYRLSPYRHVKSEGGPLSELPCIC